MSSISDAYDNLPTILTSLIVDTEVPSCALFTKSVPSSIGQRDCRPRRASKNRCMHRQRSASPRSACWQRMRQPEVSQNTANVKNLYVARNASYVVVPAPSDPKDSALS